MWTKASKKQSHKSLPPTLGEKSPISLCHSADALGIEAGAQVMTHSSALPLIKLIKECWQGPAASSTSVPPSCRVTEEEREVPDLVGEGPQPLPHSHTSPPKRVADSSPDVRVPKVPKLQQENDVAAFLARMRDQGVGFGDIISLLAAQSGKRLSFTLHLPLLTLRQIHPPRVQPQPCLLLFQGGAGLHWRPLLP